MKKYIIPVLILVSGIFFGQVTIGKTVTSSAPANASVSLELGNPTGGVKGIVLPWVTSEASVTTPAAGTLIFDAGTTVQKVKYRNATAWVDLSAGALTPITPSVADTNGEVSTAKTLIGGNALTDTTSGILVLGDTNKAMVLPRVSSHADIVNPSAGMMVYDTTTNQLALYNGREWSFWTKP
ncbi:hypothetical protein OMO38_08995 [Chryseobacterium sp. 09-1422]|uniref:Uncharacterized protein n=1 Tax=Chryseobacterium kimseyorum TaxID=2984028 RepID=A0ABT3HXX1_9FLAO|nr:hypothetical protein [Chryseobacterium kimseyorum]MCW3168664.1 hypothetical protein [Chryseobacterium kimseyorum]